jgi:hypothetical protein
MTDPTDDQIRERAHQLWELAGKPESREQEFWLEAERELRLPKSTNDANEGGERSETFLE